MTTTQQEVIGLTERGNRLGETHHRAKLTDHEVDLVLELLDEAEIDKANGKDFLTIGEIARKFEIHESTVRSYRDARRRAQYPVRFKTMKKKKTKVRQGKLRKRRNRKRERNI